MVLARCILSGLRKLVNSEEAMAAPSTPTGLAINTAFSNANKISWNSAATATYYELHRSFDNIVYSNIYEGSDLSFSDVDLPPSTTVYYKVLAGNVDGESALSSAVSGATLAQSIKKIWIRPNNWIDYDENAYTSLGYSFAYGIYCSGKVLFNSGQVDADLNVDNILAVGEYLELPSSVGDHFRIFENAYGINIQYYDGSGWFTIWRVKDGGVSEGTWNTPASITVNTGGTPVGSVSDVQTLLDGNVYQLPEVASTPGFDVEFNFTGLNYFRSIATRIWYNGSSTHDVTFDVYNYNTASWDQFYLVLSGTNYNYRYIEIPDGTNYVDGSGNAKVRLYHNSAGNASHDIYIDYIALKG